MTEQSDKKIDWQPHSIENENEQIVKLYFCWRTQSHAPTQQKQ